MQNNVSKKSLPGATGGSGTGSGWGAGWGAGGAQVDALGLKTNSLAFTFKLIVS